MPAAWDNMDVKVGDALADAVVDGYEGSFRGHPLLYSQREKAGISEEMTGEILREIPQGWQVRYRHQEGVAGEEGAMVEEGQRYTIGENDLGCRLSPDDCAEFAPDLAQFSLVLSRSGHTLPFRDSISTISQSFSSRSCLMT